MIRLLTILLTFQVLSSHGQETDTVESILLHCLTESFEENGIDLDNELDSFETYLIRNSFLGSSDGTSYYQFYQKIIALKDIPAIADPEQFAGLYSLTPDEYYSPECFSKLQALAQQEIEGSKYYSMVMAMQQAVTDSSFSPAVVARAIASVLAAPDFDKPYYRAVALLTISYAANARSRMPARLPPFEDRETGHKRCDSLNVFLSATDEVMIGLSVTSPEEFQTRLRVFILENDSSHVILLRYDRGTSYEFYKKILDLISRIYHDIREQKAQELHGRPFDELPDPEKEKIQKTYPFHISES